MKTCKNCQNLENGDITMLDKNGNCADCGRFFTTPVRVFDSGSTRDTPQGKIHYYGFQHPLCDYSFGKYMLGHQKQADGKMREANNWWHGWDRGISLDSMTRHLEDLKLIHAGYYVYKKRTATGEETIVSKKELKGLVQVTEEEACNAIRFNADAYKLEILKEL